MKLQIISRLSQSQLNKLDAMPTQRRQSYQGCMKLSHDNGFKVNPQYASMRTTQRENCEIKQKESNLRLFFANFDKNCAVKYVAEPQQQPKHKRKLQSQLRSILANRKSKAQTTQDEYQKNYFKMSKQQKQPQPKKSVLQNVLQPRELRNYYLVQQKAKQKIRKISSLVSIKQQDSAIEAKRKPGFILKKNLSLGKEGFEERFSLINIERGRGKQNNNPNCSEYASLRRNESKSNIQTVDQQISMSKQRIAMIRKQLNQIYQMRDPSRCRLKLF